MSGKTEGILSHTRGTPLVFDHSEQGKSGKNFDQSNIINKDAHAQGLVGPSSKEEGKTLSVVKCIFIPENNLKVVIT